MPFDIGEFYSGVIPVDKSKPDRSMFFVFQPRVGGPPVDEVTVSFLFSAHSRLFIALTTLRFGSMAAQVVARLRVSEVEQTIFSYSPTHCVSTSHLTYALF